MRRFYRLKICVVLLFVGVGGGVAFWIQHDTDLQIRLVDHTSYAISIIQKTIAEVEHRQWCNLKIDDLSFTISQVVLGHNVTAEVELKNGFVISIETIGITQSTIQQVWLPVRSPTTVEVRSTVRMLNVAIGFDVITTKDGNTQRSTGRILYPEMQFPFSVMKDLLTDEITVTVTGAPVRTTNLIEFFPENDVTNMFTVLYTWDSISPSVSKWATEIFQPITLRLATEDLDYPTICYDCPVT